MASIFISHSSSDLAATKRIRESLLTLGFAALFVDFDPELGIPAGRDWEHELYSQLRKADAVIFLASRASVESRWCFAEIALARSLSTPVIPLQLQLNVRMPLLNDVQSVDFKEGEAGLTCLTTRLRQAGLDPADAFRWDPRRPPYPGLSSFEAEDAAVFFGREQETARLVELLQPTLQRGPSRLVAIIGPSGSGKSSLLRAGLLPRLSRSPDRWILLPPLVPGQQPTRKLARTLALAFADYGDSRPVRELAAVLERGPSGLREIATELSELSQNGARAPDVLLVIDQAEELATRTGPGEQRAFLDLLRGSLGEGSPLWAVSTVRSEFLSSAPDRAGLATVVDDTLLVEPLDRARLPEVIAGPARRAGLDFAPGLVERIVEDTAGGDALPLLAYTLRELYERVGPSGQISSSDYEAAGGVVGALRHNADKLREDLSRRGYSRLVIPTLLKLAAVTGEQEPTRRRVLRSEFCPEEQLVLEAFVDARLINSSDDSAELSGEQAKATVEVSHEALLRHWAPLRNAIEGNREALRLRSELERLANDWQQGREDESYLVRGARLAVFDQWAISHPGELGDVEHRFLQASRALAGRSVRRLRMVTTFLAVLLVIALTAAGLAWQQSDRAQLQTRAAQIRQLESQVDRLVRAQPELAILAGLQSMSLARDARPWPPPGLIYALSRTTHASRSLTGHTDVVLDASFSPDGRLLATASNDQSVRLWDVSSGQSHGLPLTGHTAPVMGVAFSPDGRLLASGSSDSTVRLWDVTTGQLYRKPLTGHTAPVAKVAFSPDGQLIASVSGDQTVRLWDVTTGQPHGEPLIGHDGGVWNVDFSPDGELLASVGEDQTVRLWDVATGHPHGDPMQGHSKWVVGLDFSPDGRMLATGSLDNTIRLWDVTTGKPHGEPLTGHTDEVNAVAFSPDGRLIASTGMDRTVRLWDVATEKPRGVPMVGHSDSGMGIEFSPDGRLLASASADRTVRLWDVPETFTVTQPLIGHTAPVWGVAFSPDGRLLATGSDDRTARLWDVKTRQPRGDPLNGHTDGVIAVAFSPDNQLLATASADRTVRLWNVAARQARGEPLVGHADKVWAVAFSPNSELLASAGDRTVRLWDVATGQPHGKPLEGHTNTVDGVAFSPDGQILASISVDQTVRLWDVTTGQPHGEPLIGHTAAVEGVAFSPDGSLLATGSSDNTIRLWETATLQPHGGPLIAHSNRVQQVAFSANGRFLASTSADGTVQVWDVAAGGRAASPMSSGYQSYGVAFSPEGHVLATADGDGAARLWNIEFNSWVTSGCALVNRNLSISEWNQLLGTTPYERTCPNLPAGPGAPTNAPAARYAS